MHKYKAVISSRMSEIVLVLLLLVLIGFIRVYYGSQAGVMFVWKTEFTYKDTVIDLDKVLQESQQDLQKNHPAVYWQLEDMGFLAQPNDFVLRHQTP